MKNDAFLRSTANYVLLKGVKLYAFHGVLPQENQIGANYTLDARLKTDFTLAAEKDVLEGTLNYAEVFQVIRQEMAVPSRLLEHVVGRMARQLFAHFPTLTEVTLSLYKENPPMGADCEQVGVEASFRRDTDEKTE